RPRTANNGAGSGGSGPPGASTNTPPPAPTSRPWDVATGLVMLFSRYIPIAAPIAMAASLGRKKRSPFTLGTMRDDTATFGFLVFGTIVIIGALLFLPVAALGPLAEHLGPIPFGGRAPFPHPEGIADGPSAAFPSPRGHAVRGARPPAAPHPACSVASAGARGSRTEAVVRHAAPGHTVGQPGDVRGRGGCVPHAAVHRADAGHWHGQPGPNH